MLRERIEGKWIDCFAEVFTLCGAKASDAVAILSDTRSRPVNVELAELALLSVKARAFHITLPSPRLTAPAPERSTGVSDSTGANEVAGRHAMGHFDLPVRGCTIRLVGRAIVDRGRLLDELGSRAIRPPTLARDSRSNPM